MIFKACIDLEISVQVSIFSLLYDRDPTNMSILVSQRHAILEMRLHEIGQNALCVKQLDL